MSTIFLLCFFVLLLIGVFSTLARKKELQLNWPFYGMRVLTNAEQVLYWRLIEALPENIVLAQVQLSRFLGVRKGHQRIQWLNRVSQKSADFLVCNKDFSVLTVIELDDASHDRPGRHKADNDKNKAIKDAGLRIIRWHVKSMPNAAQIRDEIYLLAGVQGRPPAQTL
ncbi:DUF2726 domain-containing protein [Xanthomonas albilineans]|uniref:DUF2726 domain-containing protein n=1 Tax=Xanthomonas albilineans TaxID=29447 RepID=UPI0009BC4DEF|nr:DUF2726 domain-containing protein [Xanthomonas albilineans]PPU91425.1 DUF2726 domain-containing protein [Xanthomonas albilineans]